MKPTDHAAKGGRTPLSAKQSRPLCAAAPKKTAKTKTAAGTGKKASVQSFSLVLDGTFVPVTLTHRTKMKRMNIRFRPDGSLAVSAPPRVGRGYVEDYLRQNAARMLGHRRAAAERQVTYARLSAAPEDGILYFGEPVRVVTTATAGREGVRYGAGMLIVSQKDPADAGRRGKLLDRFQEAVVLEEMTVHCRALFPFLIAYQRQNAENPEEPLPAYAEKAGKATARHRFADTAVSKTAQASVPLSFPDIRLEHARSVWGTCASRQGVIRYSTALRGTSRDFCRYVAAHELCHLLHPDHSPAFWRAVTALCPDWKALRHCAPTIL